MRQVIIYAIEVTICSGVLTALYSFILERKVSHIFARLFLLNSVVLSATIPLLNIPVWAAKEVAQSSTITLGEASSEIISMGSGFDYRLIVWIVYGIGVAICITSMLLQMVNILRIRRGGSATTWQGITIVRSPEKIASFSFFRTIFISNQTTEDDIATIVAHEQSHIAHNHSLERLIMEFIKAFMWWNPFAWIASRRLTEVEEFEADHDVISSGCDAKVYVTTLLKHLFGYSPEIANGLHNSLTKKTTKNDFEK